MFDLSDWVIKDVGNSYGEYVLYINGQVTPRPHLFHIVKGIGNLVTARGCISDFLPHYKEPYQVYLWRFKNKSDWTSLYSCNTIPVYLDYNILIDKYFLWMLPDTMRNNWIYEPYNGASDNYLAHRKLSEELSANRGVVSLDRLLFGNRGGI